jgi:hypothetical protein
LIIQAERLGGEKGCEIYRGDNDGRLRPIERMLYVELEPNPTCLKFDGLHVQDNGYDLQGRRTKHARRERGIEPVYVARLTHHGL